MDRVINNKSEEILSFRFFNYNDFFMKNINLMSSNVLSGKFQ